jgi:hypothetical protein
MAKTLAELQQMLDALDAAMPGFLQQHTLEEDFWAAFSDVVDEIDGATAAEHFGWVLIQIDIILKRYGILKRSGHSAVADAAKLDPQDLECLAWVAEGMASLVSEASAGRLLMAGLVRQAESTIDGHLNLELTSAGLAVIRSSDQ